MEKKDSTQHDEIEDKSESHFSTTEEIIHSEEVNQTNQAEEDKREKPEHKKHTSEDKEDKDELSFNFSGIKSVFTKKRVSAVVLLFLLIIPLFFSIYFRVYPTYLPATAQWAESSLKNSIQNQFEHQIQQEAPFLPPDAIAQEARKRTDDYIANNAEQFENTIEQTAEQYKKRLQNDNGQTYLLAIDPYQYYRLLKNKIEHGHVGDEIRDGKSYDLHMLAPVGREARMNFHLFVSFLWHKFVSLFNKDISVMTTFFYIPVVFSAFSVIPAFFLGRKVSGNVGGFVAAFLLAIHAAFLNRTPAGFSDTDAYNVFFPLLIFWIFMEGFEAKTAKNSVTLIGLAGILTGLYSYAWTGWWYIFWIINASLISYLIYYFIFRFKELKSSKILQNDEVKYSVLSIFFYSLLTSIFVPIFSSLSRLKSGVFGPFNFLMNFKKVATFKIWPNVYTTVAELNAASINAIINQIGGKVLFFIALMGLCLLLTRQRYDKITIGFMGASSLWYAILLAYAPASTLPFIILLVIPIIGLLILSIYMKYIHVDIKHGLFLLFWFAATIYASRSGVRFILLLVPAFCLAFGAAIGILYERLAPWLQKQLGVYQWATKGALLILVAVLLSSSVQTAHHTAINEVPSMADAWWESLTYIKEHSQEDAIVNSWWDFGHWFKAGSDRAVTFDGASQNKPMAHWIGKVLLTDNEKEAIGILRMLDCGSTKAFDTLNSHIKNERQSVKILYSIFQLDKENAENKFVEAGLTKQDAEEVLQYTHCDPPEDFFIASEDMIGKSGVWAHFGSWDFDRATMYQQVKKMDRAEGLAYLKDEFNLSDDVATQYYSDIQTKEADRWIADWPSYPLGSWRTCEDPEGMKIVCKFNMQLNNQIVLRDVVINLTNASNSYGLISAPGSSQTQEITFHGLNIVNSTDIAYVPMDGTDTPMEILFAPRSKGKFRAMLIAPELARSMFTRMFFMEGHTLQYFDLVLEKQAVTGTKIYTYKVDWTGESKTNLLVDEDTEDITPEGEEEEKANTTSDNISDVKKSLKEQLLEGKEKQVTASHLLIKTENRTDEEALALIQEIHANITAGRIRKSRFQSFARNLSEGPSASRGGDLGTFPRGVMVKEFEDAAFALDVAELSEPVKTQFGYHIIYIESISYR